MICRGCKEGEIELLMDFCNQPIAHNLLNSTSSCFPSYPLEIGVCTACGLSQIIRPIPALKLYENYFTLSSWKNQPHVDRLIWLIQNLVGVGHQDSICEIGCNDGSFLESLKKAGYQAAYGIEPTSDAWSEAANRGLDVEQGFFHLQKASEIVDNRGRPKMVVSRQVLEHIEDLNEFMLGISELLEKGDTLLIEIPDSRTNMNLFDFAFWEEHVNNFTERTSRILLERHGFLVAFSEQIVFSGNTLVLLAVKVGRPDRTMRKGLSQEVDREIFRARRLRNLWPEFRMRYRSYLEKVSDRSGNIGIFGCGARSSTIANFIGINDYVKCYIDDQIEKQGKFVPGNLLEICPRQEIENLNIRHIILGVNAENEHKVIESNRLSDRLISWDSVLPPSRYLPSFWTEMIGFNA